MNARQSGFITLPFTAYIAIGASAVILGLSAYGYWQKSRYEACKAEFAAFQADVRAKGEAAKREADRINAENAKKKEKSDAERKRLVIANSELAGRLRDNAGRSSLPEASGNTGIPETACFRRPDLDAAIQRFTTGIAGIVTQGDSAVTDLDLARRWVNP